MPASSPQASADAAARLSEVGKRIRERRKGLRVNATTAAQAAGLSRVTLYRIERGEPSVTIGAYFNAAAALGLEIRVTEPQDEATALPERILLADYPQLNALAWQLHVTELTQQEALDIYERNWRHMDQDAIGPLEQELIQRLINGPGKGRLLV